MLRLNELDIPARLSPVMPRWMAEVLTALLVLVGVLAVRLVIDLTLPGAAPFSLLFPASLIAVLLAGWRAGVMVFVSGALFAWYFVFPGAGFSLNSSAQGISLVFVALAGGLEIFIAQVFRDIAHEASQERAAKLAERELLLSELNHRMKNNFQMVASLLELQRKRAGSDAARTALGDAVNRVMGIANAHRNLYVAGDSVTSVDVGAYLEDLCGHLQEALFAGRLVKLECRAVNVEMERDKAVALGLIVNELVTNAAKHAFEDEIAGTVQVAFEPNGDGWRLTVSDDGKGLPDIAAAKASKGLGRGLVEGFAKQAGGTLSIGSGPGATFVLEMGR